MKINLNSPGTISLLLLVGIAVCAGAYGLVTYQNQMSKRSFNNKEGYEFPYDLRRPDHTYYLPKDLVEISGMAYYRPDEVLIIQDEKASIYLYSLAQDKIVKEVDFGKNRDYEGIAYTVDDIYVLEMDGDLHRVQDFLGIAPKIDKFETLFSYRNDTEGLCYDPVTSSLLIAPKEKGLEGTNPEQRGIYAFDLAEERLQSRPVFTIDQIDLGQLVYGKNRTYPFKPSAIAIEPETNNIYVLASVGKVLLVIDRNNEILQVEMLDRTMLPQPEGLTFDNNGDLLISSEGKNGRGMIVRFSKKAPKPNRKKSVQKENE